LRFHLLLHAPVPGFPWVLALLAAAQGQDLQLPGVLELGELQQEGVAVGLGLGLKAQSLLD
jgi:hypothetical protein